MDLGAVMDEVGDLLEGIGGLRVYRYPEGNPQVPAAIVSFPETYTYDESMRRGMDRITLPVVVMVGQVSSRASRGQLAAYLDGSGASSVKEALEGGPFTAFDSIRVTGAEIDVVDVAGVRHLAATFSNDIAGPGGS